MIGTSPFARQMSKQIRKLADKKDILIIGEHGSGKRHLAHEIHQVRAKSGPYILLDGQSVTHAEIHAVLFGKHRELAHSLTGHDPAKLTNHATLCIANVDALVPHEQDLVATFLQKHRKEHAGMRVILTVTDMTKVAIDVGAFEGVEVPALRDRPEDIRDLVKSILRTLGKESLNVGDNLIRVLEKSSWPGNIRELAKVVGKGALVSKGNELELPDDYLNEHQHLQDAIENITAGKAFEMDKSLWLIEKLLIERLLGVTQNNQSHAAAAIGLSEANFRYRLKKFGVPAVRKRR